MQRSESSGDAERHAPRNFLVLIAYQVALRAGWIFKTESIIIPAVLDLLGGGSALRGCLPLVNRLGQGLAPLLAARRVKNARRKLHPLGISTLAMAGCFLALALLWWASGGQPSWWMRASFLGLYGLFFAATGVSVLVQGTLQGKLVRATRRGRLLLISNVVGSIVAIGLAWLLLPRWLQADGGSFHWVFATTGLSFLGAALLAWLLREPPDAYADPPAGLRAPLRAAWEAWRSDGNFRRLAVVGALLGSSLILFPHYQALARQSGLAIDLTHLVTWVLVQNAGTALFSTLAGPLADRHGNRLVLQVLLLGIAIAPLAALLLVEFDRLGQALIPSVFVLVGMTPVTVRIMNNYTLEAIPAEHHTRALAALNLSMAAPVLLAPPAGWLVDLVGFAPVFLAVATLVGTGWLLTFRLDEPRGMRGEGRRGEG